MGLFLVLFDSNQNSPFKTDAVDSGDGGGILYLWENGWGFDDGGGGWGNLGIQSGSFVYVLTNPPLLWKGAIVGLSTTPSPCLRQ